MTTSVLDQAWDLAPQVSVRPEPFGALLYHFGTRRLSFLKDRRLLDVVQALAASESAGAACAAAGVSPESLPSYDVALPAPFGQFGRELVALLAQARLGAVDRVRRARVRDRPGHQSKVEPVVEIWPFPL